MRSAGRRCPWPDCVLDEYHDGHHDPRGDRPQGPVIIQLGPYFSYSAPCLCEVCGVANDAYSEFFVIDFNRNAWEICTICLVRCQLKAHSAANAPIT